MTPEDKAIVDEILRRVYVDLYSIVRAALATTEDLTGAAPQNFRDLLARYMAPRKLELELEATDRYRRFVNPPIDPDAPRPA
jgi:hypothetical protein